MLIDWFTVGAQALNFIILVWLLKRFLYKPILNAVDAREQRIAAELADADAKRAEAKKERDELVAAEDALHKKGGNADDPAGTEANAAKADAPPARKPPTLLRPGEKVGAPSSTR